ncbi:MAG: deoxyribose-phosphate aldolase [Phycisphaerales bacterium]|nr:deoxyribose-phosphate aldolase [Phycisphaerales bacterium]
MTNDARNKRIAIGADHGGFALKEQLREHLSQKGYAVEDCGTFDGKTADYPMIAAAVAKRISDGTAGRGIIIDGAGIGSCMTANKFPGVRAALCYDLSSAANSREHNDANVLTLGAGLIGAALAVQIVDLWLSKECTVDRHRQRVAMIGQIERETLREGDHGASSLQHDTVTSTMNDLREVPGLVDLSNEDLERIAKRIVELAGPGGLAAMGQCACCGPACDGHCAEKNPSTVRDLIGMGASRIGHGLGGGPIAKDVAGYIDHTLLKPEATAKQIEQLCREAIEYGFASVCINPSYVKLAATLLKGSPVTVCTVAGFPLGTHVPEVKAMEARRSIREGAREIDMVINIGALKSGDDELVFRDIKSVVEACQDGRAICKVIIECALLTDEEKVRACQITRRARADYVKTSTGFSTGGATAKDVALMSEAVRGARMGVKAAGGIRSYEDVQAMVQAGATRIGASAGVQIVQAAKGVTVSEVAPVTGSKSSKGQY